jgi:hypothetical protein
MYDIFIKTVLFVSIQNGNIAENLYLFLGFEIMISEMFEIMISELFEDFYKILFQDRL